MGFKAMGRRKCEVASKIACAVCGVQVRKDWMKRHLVKVHRIGDQKRQVHIYPKVPCNKCGKKVHRLRGALDFHVPCHICREEILCTTMDYHVRTNCGSEKNLKKMKRSGRISGAELMDIEIA